MTVEMTVYPGPKVERSVLMTGRFVGAGVIVGGARGRADNFDTDQRDCDCARSENHVK